MVNVWIGNDEIVDENEKSNVESSLERTKKRLRDQVCRKKSVEIKLDENFVNGKKSSTVGNERKKSRPINLYDSLIDQPQLIVEQLNEADFVEELNRFKVYNALGKHILYAEQDEENSKGCFNMQTVFGINLLSLEGDLVAMARSEKTTILGTRKIKIECPVGTTVGYMVTEPAWTRPNFVLLDTKENAIFSVLSPWSAVFGSFKTAKFNIVSSVDKESVVGVITKKWSGLSKELFSDTDTFGINFPSDLDYSIKTVLLFCVFLIDFMFYESSI